MLSRHFARLSVLVSTALAVALSAPGCAPQEEGERCSLKNGNADCAQGLTCYPASELGRQSDICCTVENGMLRSEHPACIPSVGTASASASASSTGGMGGAGGAGSTAGTGGAGGAGGAAGAGGTGGTGG